jgi:hypothetical protein
MLTDTRRGLAGLAAAAKCELADEVFQRAWESLQNEGWSEEDLERADRVRGECLKLLKERLAALGVRKTRVRVPAWIRQAYGLSDYYATVAAEDKELCDFRKEVLENRLLERSDVITWLSQRSGTDRTQELAYVDGQQEVRFASTAGNPKLQRLGRLSDNLAKNFQWRPAAATTFILTGSPPLRWPIAVYQQGGSIRIDAAPWVPSGTVSQAYSRARRRLRYSSLRVPLSPRHLKLINFVFARGRQPSRKMCREEWNPQFPNWAYRSENNFIRDYHRTLKRFVEG